VRVALFVTVVTLASVRLDSRPGPGPRSDRLYLGLAGPYFTHSAISFLTYALSSFSLDFVTRFLTLEII
jgi:hypothetical protein